MESSTMVIIFFLILSIFFIFCILKYLCLDSRRTPNLELDVHNRIDQIREEYRERVIEMSSNQINLENTTYNVDKEIIKSLQKKYKIGINYSRHLKTFQGKLKNNQKFENNCIICLDEYSNNDLISIMKCKHIFHHKCLKKWLNESADCPICRTDVIININ